MTNSDYKTNTFVIKTTTTYAGAEEAKTFHPGGRHALQMKHLINKTVPTSPQAGVPVPVDSGYASRDSDDNNNEGAAPDVADLACALEAATVEEDHGERQWKLFAYANHKDYFLKSQRKTGVWKGAQPEFEKTLWKTNRPHFK